MALQIFWLHKEPKNSPFLLIPLKGFSINIYFFPFFIIMIEVIFIAIYYAPKFLIQFFYIFIFL